MSPLEYDTESDDENHDQIRNENTECEILQPNTDTAQSHFGITCTSIEANLRRWHIDSIPGMSQQSFKSRATNGGNGENFVVNCWHGNCNKIIRKLEYDDASLGE